MSFLNAPIPNFKCFVRERFFFDGDSAKTDFVPAVAFGIWSAPGHALGVHVLTDRGAQWHGLPLHALASRPGAPDRDIRELELWDCFSAYVSVTEFPLLSGMRCKVMTPWLPESALADAAAGAGANPKSGVCLFTIDWTHVGAEVDPGWSRLPEEHKSGHLIELDEGNFALQPNNRIIWSEPSFIAKPHTFGDAPHYRRNTRTWSVER